MPGSTGTFAGSYARTPGAREKSLLFSQHTTRLLSKTMFSFVFLSSLWSLCLGSMFVRRSPSYAFLMVAAWSDLGSSGSGSCRCCTPTSTSRSPPLPTLPKCFQHRCGTVFPLALGLSKVVPQNADRKVRSIAFSSLNISFIQVYSEPRVAIATED